MSHEQNPEKSPWKHDTFEGRTKAWAESFRADAAAIESGAADEQISGLHPRLRQAMIDGANAIAEDLEDQLKVSTPGEGGK